MPAENRLTAVDRAFLERWVALMLVFNVTSVPFNAVRHLLLMLVPATWLAADAVDRFSARSRGALLVGTAALGFALAKADYDIAGCYRTVSDSSLRPAVTAHGREGRHVWFTGNWGFFYYAVQAGAVPLVEDPTLFGLPSVEPGDMVYNPMLLTWPAFPPAGFLPAQAVEHIQPLTDNPLRTIAPGAHYYTVSAHDLPWEVLIDHVPAGDPGLFKVPPLDDILVFELLGPDGARLPSQ